MTAVTLSRVPANSTDTVADLLHGIRDGNTSAWSEILRRYGKCVSSTVRSFRLQEADSLDAVQMTWLRLFENADRVQFAERLSGWLATTARRECLHILRQSKRTLNLTDVIAETVVDPAVGPEQCAIDVDTTRRLRQLVDELSPRQRTVIRMLFAKNPCSYATIADVAAIPLGGIGPTRVRALGRLRDSLDKHER
ncbi:MAG: RNA polymerase sigma factor [Pseudonocardiaceae bacterium]